VEIRTMIVDDQADIRLLMKLMIDLANEGLVFSGEAANGEEALARVAAYDPSVIVLDEMMPGMRGLDVAEHILRARPGQVILLCSAHLDDTLRARAAAAGVKGWLHKDRLEQLPDLLRELAPTG
jgi:CheY-like chemotaxis protein